jgi:MFS family permease
LLVPAAGAGFIVLIHTPWQALGAAGVAGFGGAVIMPSQHTLLAQVVREEPPHLHADPGGRRVLGAERTAWREFTGAVTALLGPAAPTPHPQPAAT